MSGGSARQRWSAEWPDGLRVFEPTRAQLVAAAPRLSAFYNLPANRRMLAHDEDLSPADVVTWFDELWADGDVPFLLERAGAVIGDADLRNLADGVAECAILVGDPAAQNQGLGTRFLIMVHALAFGVLALSREYCSIIPANGASRRLFEKLGYQVDDSPEAREFVDEDDDISLSLGRDRFLALHAAAVADIRVVSISERSA